MSGAPLLQVRNLQKYFPIKAGVFRKIVDWVKAVDGVSFEVLSGETLGIVGESGCGKSTLGMTIMRLYEPTAGEVFFQGQDISSLRPSELKSIRRNIQMIFQDPFTSLDPRMHIGSIVEEGMKVHHIASLSEIRRRALDLLEKVGLGAEYFSRYPHEFSGGQRQRIGIARALALNPRLVVADEPVSSLDVSVRSQILNLLKDLKRDYQLTYIFISHDLAVVRQICNRVMVMYLGKIVEIADGDAFFSSPSHPYSVALISAVPVPDPDYEVKRIILSGDVPSPINPPQGCRFHTRCPVAQDVCSEVEPALEEIEENHWVACHFPGSLSWERIPR
ncbi:MAG: peptide/nickel transport system ATP-binding protein [Candidatus Atribacteria bacterium]|nr:peptide/nickel transport system ATP-binding protein [Candidatus Atribacteria bacterium]